MLTQKQIDFVKQKLYEWEKLANQGGYDTHLAGAMANIDHSALLIRLLLGVTPLKYAPPKSYSYPWYDLIETGYSNSCEMHGPYVDGWLQGKVVVNQHPWEYIVTTIEGWLMIRDGRWFARIRNTGPAAHNNRIEILTTLEDLQDVIRQVGARQQ